MMAETHGSVERCEVARDVASEAIDALLTVYWADSLNTELLEDRLAETIQFFTRNALHLSDAHPQAEILEESAIALQVISNSGLDGSEARQPSSDLGVMGRLSSQSPEQPLIDLRDRPSPEILRILAIGSPQVVNVCVMTLFQLGYARPEEWSRQLPTVNPGEVMRILTKRVMFAE